MAQASPWGAAAALDAWLEDEHMWLEDVTMADTVAVAEWMERKVRLPSGALVLSVCGESEVVSHSVTSCPHIVDTLRDENAAAVLSGLLWHRSTLPPSTASSSSSTGHSSGFGFVCGSTCDACAAASELGYAAAALEDRNVHAHCTGCLQRVLSSKSSSPLSGDGFSCLAHMHLHAEAMQRRASKLQRRLDGDDDSNVSSDGELAEGDGEEAELVGGADDTDDAQLVELKRHTTFLLSTKFGGAAVHVLWCTECTMCAPIHPLSGAQLTPRIFSQSQLDRDCTLLTVFGRLLLAAAITQRLADTSRCGSVIGDERTVGRPSEADMHPRAIFLYKPVLFRDPQDNDMVECMIDETEVHVLLPLASIEDSYLVFVPRNQHGETQNPPLPAVSGFLMRMESAAVAAQHVASLQRSYPMLRCSKRWVFESERQQWTSAFVLWYERGAAGVDETCALDVDGVAFTAHQFPSAVPLEADTDVDADGADEAPLNLLSLTISTEAKDGGLLISGGGGEGCVACPLSAASRSMWFWQHMAHVAHAIASIGNGY